MLTNMIKTVTLGVLSVGLFACAEATSSSPCGDGESVAVNGASYCVYKEAIVIVGGFDCPASMRFRMDFQNATVCGDHAFDDIDVPNDICARAFVPCTPNDDSDASVGPLRCGGTVCAPANATGVCVRGQCTIATCNTDFGDCDGNSDNGCEADLSSASNCGACGVFCSDGGLAMCNGHLASSEICDRQDNDCDARIDEDCVAYAADGGGVCTSALDCAQVNCSDYGEPVLPLQECLDGLGVWEGVCGSVRYRSVSGGYTGSTLYWDNASGTLLAARLWSDSPTFCADSAFSVVQGDATVPSGCDLLEDATTSLCAQ